MNLVDSTILSVKELIVEAKHNGEPFLPSEGELCTRFNVSKATVREAIRSLEVRGFVKRIHGKGIKITGGEFHAMTQSLTDLFEQEGITLDEVMEVRELVEIKSAYLAAQRATAEDIKVLRSYVDLMVEKPWIDEPYLMWDFNFHQALVQSTGNKMLIAITEGYSTLLQALIHTAEPGSTENLEQIYHHHGHIVDAIERGDAVCAKETMQAHISATYLHKAKRDSSIGEENSLNKWGLSEFLEVTK